VNRGGVKRPLTLFHSGDDGGKVIVQQDHVGRLLGDVGAGDPHGNADVCLFQGWRVVDTVTRHGHNGSLPGGGEGEGSGELIGWQSENERDRKRVGGGR